MRRAGLLFVLLLLTWRTEAASATRGLVLDALDESCADVPSGLDDAYLGATATLYAAVALVLIVVLWNGLSALLMQSVASAVGACLRGGRKAADAPLRLLLIARSKLPGSVRDAADEQLRTTFGGPKVRRRRLDRHRPRRRPHPPPSAVRRPPQIHTRISHAYINNNARAPTTPTFPDGAPLAHG